MPEGQDASALGDGIKSNVGLNFGYLVGRVIATILNAWFAREYAEYIHCVEGMDDLLSSYKDPRWNDRFTDSVKDVWEEYALLPAGHQKERKMEFDVRVARVKFRELMKLAADFMPEKMMY